MSYINCSTNCVYQANGKCFLSKIADNMISSGNNSGFALSQNRKDNISDCSYYRKK
ncbi:hypothetical protein [Thermoanaerobacterium sp. RBIITD]|uniref:hypothetical protein n=1 Tax=Thermoanaerobacterium sp. RBIITD TaxID=1550240 RepID=UPI000BC0BAA5|nr:hypothetical protein [Thermoanaerobacterium sp. RBIITD]SNX53000.1 hypothetical protein SAMN05660242_0489 [Thermoanaerobacterium sp. RBIITD]